MLHEANYQHNTALKQYSAVDTPSTSDHEGDGDNLIIGEIIGSSENKNDKFIKCTNVSVCEFESLWGDLEGDIMVAFKRWNGCKYKESLRTFSF